MASVSVCYTFPTRKMLENNAKGAERRRNPLSDRTNSNPSTPNPLPSSPSSSSLSSTFNICGSVLELHVSERKNQKKVALPMPRISNIRDKSNGAECLNLPKAKPVTVPCRKKRRVVLSYEKDELQDFIEKQKAYFKEVDEFKLAEEEVESIDELD